MFGAALAPAWAPHTMLQCVAAVMSGQNIDREQQV